MAAVSGSQLSPLQENVYQN